MTASRKDIKEWIEIAQNKGATHLIVGLDPMEYENFPVYVLPRQNVKDMCSMLTKSGNRYDEVYSFTGEHSVESQLRERRAMHFD